MRSASAVWVLNIEQKALFHELKMVAVPGGNNANLAAQSLKQQMVVTSGLIVTCEETL
jgi:hypothetical protein